MAKHPTLKEWHFSTTGKLFAAGVAAYLLGRLPHLKLRGSPQEIDKLKSAIVSSKKFQDALRSGGSVEDVMRQLKIKNWTAAEFERLTGIKFPL